MSKVFSTRKDKLGVNGMGDWCRKVLVCAVAVAAVAGCARRQTTTALDATAPEPELGAMQGVRSFEPVAATYENTAVIAWSTRFPFVDRADIKDSQRPVVEPTIFLANLVSLPVSIIVQPPFKSQIAWRTGGVGPTFTAVPPLDDVVAMKEGAIVPALRPELGYSKASATTRPAKTSKTSGNSEEWVELVPVRTEKGIVLVKPGEAVPEAPPEVVVPAEPIAPAGSSPAVTVEPGPAVPPSASPQTSPK